MKKLFPFGTVLARVRREAGFVNAHSFYKSRAGRRTLKLSFPNYRALERGLSLPKPWRLEALIQALGLQEGSPAWRELVMNYLTSWLGSDALLRGLLSSAPPALSFGEEAVRESIRQRAAQLDLGQWRALAGDAAAYYCHVYLVNTPGYRDAAELALALGLPPTQVRSALKVLAAARIVETSGPRARSLFAYKSLQTLPLLPETLHLKAPILKAREAFAGRRGTLVRRRNLTARLSAAKLESYFPRLAEAVAAAGVYGNAEKADDTAGYFIDARVFRIFD